MTDARIAYGAGACTWWDSIDKVGKKRPSAGIHSLPCCPHCGSMLFEMAPETEWFRAVDAHEARGNPGYRAMVEWGRGRCFKNYDELKAAYAARA